MPPVSALALVLALIIAARRFLGSAILVAMLTSIIVTWLLCDLSPGIAQAGRNRPDHCLGQRALFAGEITAQRAGNDGHDDVVELGVKVFRDRLGFSKGKLDAGKRTLAADRDIERGAWPQCDAAGNLFEQRLGRSFAANLRA